MTTIDEFLQTLPKIPPNPAKQARLFARELALGMYLELWGDAMYVNPKTEINNYFFAMSKEYDKSASDNDEWIKRLENLDRYYECRWESKSRHYLRLLERFGYLDDKYDLSKAAFDLLDESEPYNVFLSYKRSENSMFVLLVNNTLKLNGLSPFFDMELNPTEEWHARLEDRIKTSDYFVVLLGPETHCSGYTVKEIHWAIKHHIPVVQVRKHGYTFNASVWENVEHPEVAQKLEREQAVVPIADSAEGYHFAMEKLLNFLGITP